MIAVPGTSGDDHPYPPGMPLKRWVLGALSVVLVWCCLVVVAAIGAVREHAAQVVPPRVEDTMSAALRAELGERAARILESEAGAVFVVDNENDGRHVVCAAHVLGADPRGLTQVFAATSVYVIAECSSYHPGDDDESGGLAPLAIRLRPDVQVRVPREGEYSPSIRRMFPERLYGVAFAHQNHVAELHAEIDAGIKRRIRQAG